MTITTTDAHNGMLLQPVPALSSKVLKTDLSQTLMTSFEAAFEN